MAVAATLISKEGSSLYNFNDSWTAFTTKIFDVETYKSETMTEKIMSVNIVQAFY